LADRHAAILAETAKQCSARSLLGASSTYTKDVLPRVAALLDAPMVSDVVGVELRNGEVCYRRPLSAGSFYATVQVEGEVRVLTLRATAFEVPTPNCQLCPIWPVTVEVSQLPTGTQLVSRAEPNSSRPELTEARVVVSGGRPLMDKDTFERLIGGLADSLGAAVGATRAAVDAGLVTNDCQVGQTGKTIAPELYFAVGVSGAIQHLAGIKDSKVIVAINRDPNAPIFQIANYGLVGDLHDLVPRLTAAIQIQRSPSS
jgi:electron transfer flavoprotein alpha subunit